MPPLATDFRYCGDIFMTTESLSLEALHMLDYGHTLGLHVLLPPGGRGGAGVLQQGSSLMSRIPTVHRLEMMDCRQGRGFGTTKGGIWRLNITDRADKSSPHH